MQAIYSFKARVSEMPQPYMRLPISYTFVAPEGAKYVSFRLLDDYIVAVCLLVDPDVKKTAVYELMVAELGVKLSDDLVFLDERYDDGFPTFLFTKPGQLGK